jgi:hypothetical protein
MKTSKNRGTYYSPFTFNIQKETEFFQFLPLFSCSTLILSLHSISNLS